VDSLRLLIQGLIANEEIDSYEIGVHTNPRHKCKNEKKVFIKHNPITI
jgi:hypothetical protein